MPSTEGDTLAKVTQLRQQVAQASSPAEAMAASDALSRQVAGIFAVAENLPRLESQHQLHAICKKN